MLEKKAINHPVNSAKIKNKWNICIVFILIKKVYIIYLA